MILTRHSGFALPELQKRFSPLAAGIIVGVIWATWHIPLIGIEFQGQIIPAFLLGIMSASVLSTWLFNRSEGSLLPLALFHAAVNTTGAGYVFRMFTGSDLTRLWWIFVFLWMAAAVLSAVVGAHGKPRRLRLTIWQDQEACRSCR